ncbi:MAG: urea transporter [Actinomycetes bacterium]
MARTIRRTIASLRTSALGSFGEWVLRGVGQVFLQNNPLTGTLFLLGIFLSSRAAGMYALLGTVTATGTALLLGVPRSSVAQGLYGFNGTLTAIALSFYLRHEWQLAVYVVVASAASSILAGALQNFLSSDHIPSLTVAFVTTTWLFLAGLQQFSALTEYRTDIVEAHLPQPQGRSGGALHPHDLFVGFFNGFSEVLLQAGVWSGAAILLGILVNSRISAAAAAVGTLIGFGAGWLLGFPVDAVSAGLTGYNSLLTTIALGGVYYVLTIRSALFAAFGGLVTLVAYAALTSVLAPFGLPVLTAPFVLTTWTFLYATSSPTALRVVHPDDASTPEGNLRKAGRPWARARVVHRWHETPDEE